LYVDGVSSFLSESHGLKAHPVILMLRRQNGQAGNKKTPHPVFTVRGLLLGGCTSERALELGV
jgi:hypothetical protein